MTRKKIGINKLIKAIVNMAILLGFVLCANDAIAAYDSPNLFIQGKMSECAKQKRGGATCLKELNKKSCINTTPFTPMGGVTSEMCARGKIWCSQNDPHRKHKRCQNVDRGYVGNHEGYDYHAACGTTIQAPCDGKITKSQKEGLRYECTVCGKNIEYVFHHNQSAKENGIYKKGQKIGEAGNLYGYPCHMHIEIRSGGVLLDPMNSGFDNYVCSCAPQEQRVNRMSCFGVGSASDLTAAGEPPLNPTDPNNPNEKTVELMNNHTSSGCNYFEVMYNYQQFGCIFCTPFRILFNTISVMAKKTYDVLAPAVIGVVLIGFAIWLAIVVMRFVSHFETREPRIFVKAMLNQAFRVLVVVLLLQGPVEQLMSMTLDPIFATGLKLAQTIGGEPMSASGCGLVDGSTTSAPSTAGGENGGEATTSGAVQSVINNPEEAGLSPEMGNGIICTIKNTQDQIIDILALARVMHCLAWDNTTLIFIPNFAYLLTAFLFFIAAFILMLAYPFLLVDSMLKMAVAIALLPVALAAYAFKITSKYLAKVFGTFIDAIMTFIFLSLVIMIVTTIAKEYVGDMRQAHNFEELDEIAKIVWFTIGAIKIIFVLFLGWAVLDDIKSFAKKFAGSIGGGGGIGGRMNIGSAVGLTANTLLKNYAVNPAINVTKKGAKSGAALLKENINHGYRKVKSLSFSSLAKPATNDDGTNMLDEDGNQMYKTGGSSIGRAWNAALGKMKRDDPSSWIGEKFNKALKKVEVNTHSHYRSYGTDTSGNVIETKTQINADGSKTIVQKDDFGSISTTYDENGNIIKQSSSRNKILKRIVNKRGEVDNATIAAFVQSSLMSHTNQQLMIMDALIKSRMQNYVGGTLDDRFLSRNISSSVDGNGNRTITITQKNENGTVTTFSAQFVRNRVMTKVSTMDKNGKGVSYETDGIIQRKSVIDGDKETRQYSVANTYSKRSNHPVYISGDVSANIPKQDILFSQDDMKEFGQQVQNVGNKAYTFSEFK